MAVSFNGSTGYLQWDKGAGTMPVTAYPFSMLCWMSAASLGSFQHALMIQSSSSNWFGTIGANASHQANVQAYDGATFGDAPYTGSPSADTTLRLCVAVFSSASSVRIYWVDSTRTNVDTTALTSRVASYDRITVGARNAAGSLMQFLQGDVAECHFYSVALSGSNVDSVAGGTLPETITGWVDGWQLKTASDLTSMGGARTLTLTGGVTTSGLAHPVSRGTAPVITGPSGAATGNGTASGTATTTGTDGTLYAVRSAAQPTNAQIVAGQDSTGAASSAGSLAITSAGAKTIPLTGVAVPTGSQTVWFLHRPAAGAASDSNVVSAAWTQPTPATLSSPTNTPGSTTALVGCTTNTTSGTLYALARVGGSAASASTIVATGQTATVSTTTPSKTYTGLTASTSNYYVDMVQGVGVTTSNVVTTGPFTTSASGDTTPPTLTGSIVIGTVSSTTIQISWPAGSDNVAVTSYEVSKDSGTNWTDVGNVLTYTFTGLTASTSYGLRVRAKDAAGNVSTPALAATQSTSAAGGVGSINLNNAALYVFKKNNATTIASTSVTFWVSDVTTGALVGSAITGLSTNASGLVTTAISNASMVAGTTYRLNYEFSSGEYGCVKLPAV